MRKIAGGILGLIAGGLIGYVMRPAAPLIGQLPFKAVISRGASLQGLEQLLVPLAQRSFNSMLSGALLGIVAGILVTHLLAPRRKADAGAPP